ncbi:MAG: hypothetical protein CMD29_03085 [Flavobacteriales bacterium]|nr:hypothetical protein [Flavobacteriales bacterium]
MKFIQKVNDVLTLLFIICIIFVITHILELGPRNSIQIILGVWAFGSIINLLFCIKSLNPDNAYQLPFDILKALFWWYFGIMELLDEIF